MEGRGGGEAQGVADHSTPPTPPPKNLRKGVALQYFEGIRANDRFNWDELAATRPLDDLLRQSKYLGSSCLIAFESIKKHKSHAW
jgi:hypothetical protein